VGERAETLSDLGWDDALAEAFAVCEAETPDGRPARISRIDRGGWITAEAPGETIRARQHPRSRRARSALDVPTVGDWVVLRPDPGGGEPVAETLLPRRSVFVRNVGEDDRAQPQPLAANIDSVFIVVSSVAPYNARRTDRLLSLAWASGAEPVMVMTKADAVDDIEAIVDEVRGHVLDVQVTAISVRTGQGLDRLEPHLTPGRTLVLIGQSGAGKSTLANHLAGDELLAAAEVRKDEKGRHTTSHRQLLRLPNGALLIDTPGLRSVGLWESGLDEGAFADIEQLAAECRFANCVHDQEPGCAVQAALASGELAADRWASYAKLRDEAEQVTRARELAARAQRGGRRRR
jgi:ribosome biogenesis GTPase